MSPRAGPAIPVLALPRPLHSPTRADLFWSGLVWSGLTAEGTMESGAAAQVATARPGWPARGGVPVPVGGTRGVSPRELRALKAPHFQELHLEVLLAERGVVEGLAVLRVSPEQAGVQGQGLASPSTCKSERRVGPGCPGPSLPVPCPGLTPLRGWEGLGLFLRGFLTWAGTLRPRGANLARIWALGLPLGLSEVPWAGGSGGCPRLPGLEPEIPNRELFGKTRGLTRSGALPARQRRVRAGEVPTFTDIDPLSIPIPLIDNDPVHGY